MHLRRLLHIPLLCLLIVNLLISPAVTSGYVWCVTDDGHSFLEEAFAGDCAADDHVGEAENIASADLPSINADGCGPCLDISASHRWGNSRSRQDELPVGRLVGIAPTTDVSPVPLPERELNTHRTIAAAPRTPDLILHHRTTVLLI